MREYRTGGPQTAWVVIVAVALLSSIEPNGNAQDATATPNLTAIPDGQTTLRVYFGNKVDPKTRKKTPTKWDGTVTVSGGGRLTSVELEQKHAFAKATANGWKMTNIRTIPRMAAQRAKGYNNMPPQQGVIYLTLQDVAPSTRLDFKTAQGDFSVTMNEIGFGPELKRLKALVGITRVPNTVRFLQAPTEDDFPAAVYGADGALHVAYTAFTHGKGFEKRPPITKPLDDFEFLTAPTGGDQILLVTLRDGKWSKPAPVTPTGQDVYRLAIAEDGDSRLWVIWSAGVDDNWDLYSRRRGHDGQWSAIERVTVDAGPDTFPAATTDDAGHVWIAWQAFRGDNADILAARQEGDGFGKPLRVSDSPRNEWAPSIAASKTGSVAVAWDTYARGNYDVVARVWSKSKLGEPVVVAASGRAEMRASAAYDAQDRLWIAYESGSTMWGKDWGKEEVVGARLYSERRMDVRVFAGGRLMETMSPPAPQFVPAAAPPINMQRLPATYKLAAPRLTVDNDGRVWLAVRRGSVGSRPPVGSVWFERLSYYDGQQWSRAAPIAKTDGLLDNRPALLPRPTGGVTMIGSTDQRNARAGLMPARLQKRIADGGIERVEGSGPKPGAYPDPVNSELVMATVENEGLPKPVAMKLKPVAKEESASSAVAKKEADDVDRIQTHRATINGKTQRILRGEFHRHTEISGDGGNDGMLMDMWRYGLDAVAFDWIGNGDHDNGSGRDYSWWIIQKTTDMFTVPGAFSPMYTYERSCLYPDGHRNVVFAKRGVRALNRFRPGLGKDLDKELAPDDPRPNSPDTQMLYRYLKQLDGVCASHTSATDMGTDWRDNDPLVEPVVEIYQGDRQNYEMPGAPRSNTADDSAGGWRPLGFVSLALKKGFRLGFQASSDHVSTHISYCNVWVEEMSREAILDAMKKRHIYGATDNIIAEFRCGEHFMGDEFTTDKQPTFEIKIIGTEPLAKVHIIKDGKYVYSASFDRADVSFEWTDTKAAPGKTSYYYVRGEQSDGELVWISPMWITYKP